MPKLIATAAILALLAVPGFAEARAERTVRHQFDKVWPTAIRHLRIDEGHKIVEKDADTGYVVFEVSERGKTYRGTLELVRFSDKSKGNQIRLILQIEDRPEYSEHGILDRMLEKLRQEQGDEPPPPKPEPPAKKKPDNDEPDSIVGPVE